MSDQQAIQLYRQMWLIRYFKQQIEALFKAGWIEETPDLCMGQEATAVGACAALQPGDQMTCTHVAYGHTIAHGADVNKVMAELFVPVADSRQEKGGSIKLANGERENVGESMNSGGIPAAVGSALSAQMKNEPYISLCFFDESVISEDHFHEALHMAANMDLPIVFICETNQSSMSSSVDQVDKIKDVSAHAKAYGVPSVTSDGNNVVGVYHTTEEAIDRARSGQGPTLIEMNTYCWHGYSKPDQGAMWKVQDPIKRLESRLVALGILTKAQIADMKAGALETVKASVRFAQTSEQPAK